MNGVKCAKLIILTYLKSFVYEMNGVEICKFGGLYSRVIRNLTDHERQSKTNFMVYLKNF